MYNEDQILDWGCDLATQKILMKNVEKSRTPLTHHGHPGREVTFVDSWGGSSHCACHTWSDSRLLVGRRRTFLEEQLAANEGVLRVVENRLGDQRRRRYDAGSKYRDGCSCSNTSVAVNADLRFSCSVDDGGGPIYCSECREFVTEIRGSRRPHYRRQKHGMPTWLIVVLVILGIKIGGGILIGGIVLLADFAESNQNWVTFQPPGGELQVDMPSTPKKEKSTADDVMPGNLDLYLCERRRGRECFGVGVVDNLDDTVDAARTAKPHGSRLCRFGRVESPGFSTDDLERPLSGL